MCCIVLPKAIKLFDSFCDSKVIIKLIESCTHAHTFLKNNNKIKYYLMIKIQYLKQIHIVILQPSLSSLKQRLKSIFKTLPSSFSFSYLDEEGDNINLDSEQDYQIFYQQALAHQKSKRLFKIEIHSQEEQFPQKLDSSVEEVMQQKDGYSSIQILNDVSHLSEVSFDYEATEEILTIQHKINDGNFLEYTEELQVGEFVQENSFQEDKNLYEHTSHITIKQNEENALIVSEEISKYLKNTYQTLQEACSNQIIQNKQQRQKQVSKIHFQQEQLYRLIQLKLKQLLPSYMEKIAIKTVQNISLILKKQNISV